MVSPTVSTATAATLYNHNNKVDGSRAALAPAPAMPPPLITSSPSISMSRNMSLRAHESSYHLPSPPIQHFGPSSTCHPLRQLSEQLNLTSSPNTHPKNYQQPVARLLSQFGSPQYAYIPMPFNLTTSQDYSYYTPQQQERYQSAAQQINQYQLNQSQQRPSLLPHHHTVLHHLSNAHFAHSQENNSNAVITTSSATSYTQTRTHPEAEQHEYTSSVPVVTTFSQSDNDAVANDVTGSKWQRTLSDRVIVKLSKHLMSTYNGINEKYYTQKKVRQLQQQQQIEADAVKQQQQYTSQLHHLHQAHSLSQLHSATHHVDSTISKTSTLTHSHTHTTHHSTHHATLNEATLYNNGYDDRDYNYIVQKGELLNDRYQVDTTLGKGSFGKVVRAYDCETQMYVAVKIVKSKSAFYKQAQIEINILQALQAHAEEHNIVKVIDTFMHHNHQCLVFELLHINLYELLKHTKFTGLPLQVVANFSMQLLDTLNYLQSFTDPDLAVLHCDLKPENVLLKHDHGFPVYTSSSTTPRMSCHQLASLSQNPRVCVIDFGSACYAKQKAYVYIQSRFYRAPEVLLNLPYNTAIDMFSLGCIMFELYTGRALFDGSCEEDQIMKQVEVLGVPPSHMLEMNRKASKYFDKVTSGYDGTPMTFLPKKPSIRKPLRSSMGNTHWQDDAVHYAFEDLILSMLNYDPKRRILPYAAMQHPFFKLTNISHPLLESSVMMDMARQHSEANSLAAHMNINMTLSRTTLSTAHLQSIPTAIPHNGSSNGFALSSPLHQTYNFMSRNRSLPVHTSTIHPTLAKLARSQDSNLNLARNGNTNADANGCWNGNGNAKGIASSPGYSARKLSNAGEGDAEAVTVTPGSSSSPRNSNTGSSSNGSRSCNRKRRGRPHSVNSKPTNDSPTPLRSHDNLNHKHNTIKNKDSNIIAHSLPTQHHPALDLYTNGQTHTHIHPVVNINEADSTLRTNNGNPKHLTPKIQRTTYYTFDTSDAMTLSLSRQNSDNNANFHANGGINNNTNGNAVLATAIPVNPIYDISNGDEMKMPMPVPVSLPMTMPYYDTQGRQHTSKIVISPQSSAYYQQQVGLSYSNALLHSMPAQSHPPPSTLKPLHGGSMPRRYSEATALSPPSRVSLGSNHIGQSYTYTTSSDSTPIQSQWHLQTHVHHSPSVNHSSSHSHSHSNYGHMSTTNSNELTSVPPTNIRNVSYMQLTS